MMTPAGWAHLDYDTDEAAVQLQETLERSGREIEPFSRYVLYQTLASPQRSTAGLPAGRVRLADGHDRPTSSRSCTTSSSDEGDDVTYRSQGSRYSDRHRVVVLPRPDDRRDDRLRRLRFGASRRPNTLHVSFEDTDGARSGAARQRRDPLLRAVRLSRLRTTNSKITPRFCSAGIAQRVRRRAGNQLDAALRRSDAGPGPGRALRRPSTGCLRRVRAGVGGAARHRRARRARARRRRSGARPRFRRRRDELPRRPPRCGGPPGSPRAPEPGRCTATV